jgi:hypothetical protein
MNKKIIEIGYHNYEPMKICSYEITPLMVDLAESVLFEMCKDTKTESQIKITEMRKGIRKGRIFPNIVIEENADGDFVTIRDGLHRTIAHSLENKKHINALIVKRV